MGYTLYNCLDGDFSCLPAPPEPEPEPEYDNQDDYYDDDEEIF